MVNANRSDRQGHHRRGRHRHPWEISPHLIASQICRPDVLREDHIKWRPTENAPGDDKHSLWWLCSFSRGQAHHARQRSVVGDVRVPVAFHLLGRHVALVAHKHQASPAGQR